MGKWRPGMTPKTKGKGKGAIFLCSLVGRQDSGCILWPYSKLPTGYGHLGFNGKIWRAHRLMCVFAHGNPPTPKHEASHSCHNPLCVNPRHLSWKTHSENTLEKRANGTHVNNRWGSRGKLMPDEVRKIRKLKGQLTQATISELFDIGEFAVRSIHQGKTYRNVA